MSKEENTVEYLVKGLDIIARDINSMGSINPYLAIIGVISLVVWLITLSGIPGVPDTYIYALYLVSGLTAYTLLYTSLFLVYYKSHKHVEYSTFYFLHLSDIAKNIWDIDLEGVEKLSLLKKPRLEYSLLALVSGYLSLLYYRYMVLDLLLLIISASISGYYIYTSLRMLLHHVLIENSILDNMEKTIRLGDVEFSVFGNDPLKLSLANTVSLYFASIYLVYAFNQMLDTHLTDHRIIHKTLKRTIYNTLYGEKGEREDISV